MPPRRNSPSSLGRTQLRSGKAGSKPPKVMTWPLAIPALAFAVIFDLARLFFVMFWFFGPALAGLYCSSLVGGVWVVGKVLTSACAAGSTYVGVVSYGVTAAFGTIMAMAVGFTGWLFVGGWLLATNARIFKENTMWFVGSLLFSEIPIIGAIPSITISVRKMYSNQIKLEKAAYKKWEKENADALAAERRQQARLAQQQEQEEEKDHLEEGVADEEESEGGGTVGENGEEKNQQEPATRIPFAPESWHPQPSPEAAQPEINVWSPGGGKPSPLTPEYGYSKTPPPLPTAVPSHTSAQPPPLPILSLPPQTKVRTLSSDERSVEQVALRNNAFIVHTITEGGVQHHNSNSNVSENATYADSMDITLALEPSISASSVVPGKRAGLWTVDGFLLAGGQIGEVGPRDIGTRAHGIKMRGGANSPIKEIDAAVMRNTEAHEEIYKNHGSFVMNELVVNNPEVFGFFQQAARDADGRYWAYNLETKKEYAEVEKVRRYGSKTFDNNLTNYRRRFATAQDRGIPLYIMTPEREVYEALKVSDDGTVAVGKQLTPEEVAKGRAGLAAEKRKEIGERILKKNLFRGEKIQKEAEE